MTDQLYELMQVIHSYHHGGCADPDCLDGVFTDEETATAILARWRLVPVEQQQSAELVEDFCNCLAGYEHYKRDHAAQHRAASEHTRHET